VIGRENFLKFVIAPQRNIGAPLAEARIGNRVALASALHRGKGITEYEASSTAAHEIEALAKEILGRLG